MLSLSHNPPKEKWKENLAKEVNSIMNNEYGKIVMACESTFKFKQKVNSVNLLYEMAKKEPNCSVYFQQFNEQESFLSVTPESLFFRKNKHINIDVLAGTIPITTNKEFQNKFLENKKISVSTAMF